MDQLTIGILGFFVFLALRLLRVPIAYAMSMVGLSGVLILHPIDAAFKFISTGMFTYTSNFTLAALPLFFLMGTLAFYADLQRVLTTLTSRDLMSVMAVKEYLNCAPESGPAVRSMASNLLALSTQAARKA